MSFNGPLQPTQTLCQQDFTLTAGTFAAGSAPIGGPIGAGGVSPAGTYQSFNNQTSKIVGVKGKTLGGVVPYQNISVNLLTDTIPDVLAGGGTININSSINTDTNTYTVYWVNTVYPGLSPC